MGKPEEEDEEHAGDCIMWYSSYAIAVLIAAGLQKIHWSNISVTRRAKLYLSSYIPGVSLVLR